MFNELNLIHGVESNVISMQSKHGIFEMYTKNAVLQAIVELSCLAFSRGEYKVTDSKGETVENSTLLNPFLKPINGNSEQFWQMFKRQLTLYDKVVILQKNKMLGVFKDNSEVKILDYLYVTIYYKTDYSIYDNNIIDYIEYTENSKTYKLTTSDFTIISVNSLNSNEEYFSLTTIQKELNTIYTAQQVVLTTNKKTMYGILSPRQDSNNSKGGYDTTSVTGLSAEEQKKIQDNLAKFALANSGNNNSIYVSPRSMVYQSLMPDIQRMNLIENNIAAVKVICSLLKFPITSLNFTDSKYSDKLLYSKELYTENIQPSWTLYEFTLNGMYNNRITDKISIDYSQIEVLQSDKKTNFETNLIESQNIIQLNLSIFNKQISFESAVTLLVKQGYNESQAVILLTNQNTLQNGIQSQTA